MPIHVYDFFFLYSTVWGTYSVGDAFVSRLCECVERGMSVHEAKMELNRRAKADAPLRGRTSAAAGGGKRPVQTFPICSVEMDTLDKDFTFPL